VKLQQLSLDNNAEKVSGAVREREREFKFALKHSARGIHNQPAVKCGARENLCTGIFHFIKWKFALHACSSICCYFIPQGVKIFAAEAQCASLNDVSLTPFNNNDAAAAAAAQ
jgi:hypothetical protein